MRYPVSAGIYAIVVGSLMIIMWSIFVATGQVPEFQSRPVEITLHLIAEFVTATGLVIGGALTIRKIRLGVPILLFSMGLLMYTLIVSPGYYIEGGAVFFVLMFALVFVLSAIFLITAVRRTLQSLQR